MPTNIHFIWSGNPIGELAPRGKNNALQGPCDLAIKLESQAQSDGFCIHYWCGDQHQTAVTEAIKSRVGETLSSKIIVHSISQIVDTIAHEPNVTADDMAKVKFLIDNFERKHMFNYVKELLAPAVLAFYGGGYFFDTSIIIPQEEVVQLPTGEHPLFALNVQGLTFIDVWAYYSPQKRDSSYLSLFSIVAQVFWYAFAPFHKNELPLTCLDGYIGPDKTFELDATLGYRKMGEVPDDISVQYGEIVYPVSVLVKRLKTEGKFGYICKKDSHLYIDDRPLGITKVIVGAWKQEDSKRIRLKINTIDDIPILNSPRLLALSNEEFKQFLSEAVFSESFLESDIIKKIQLIISSIDDDRAKIYFLLFIMRKLSVENCVYIFNKCTKPIIIENLIATKSMDHFVDYSMSLEHMEREVAPEQRMCQDIVRAVVHELDPCLFEKSSDKILEALYLILCYLNKDKLDEKNSIFAEYLSKLDLVNYIKTRLIQRDYQEGHLLEKLIRLSSVLSNEQQQAVFAPHLTELATLLCNQSFYIDHLLSTMHTPLRSAIMKAIIEYLPNCITQKDGFERSPNVFYIMSQLIKVGDLCKVEMKRLVGLIFDSMNSQYFNEKNSSEYELSKTVNFFNIINDQCSDDELFKNSFATKFAALIAAYLIQMLLTSAIWVESREQVATNILRNFNHQFIKEFIQPAFKQLVDENETKCGASVQFSSQILDYLAQEATTAAVAHRKDSPQRFFHSNPTTVEAVVPDELPKAVRGA